MLITTENEIQSLMPTARWDKPQLLFGYLKEEEMVALEPLLGGPLLQHVLAEYDRLRGLYTDLTATTIRPSGKARQDARLAHADVTERLEQIQAGKYREPYTTAGDEEVDVPASDMKTIELIQICQRIEWNRMFSHKAWLLNVSFNEGGGMNMVSGEAYEPASKERIEGAIKDAYMAAGRAEDTLLLFLESDAKGERLFTELWQEADAFYLHRDLLFQTARVLDEYLDIDKQRKVYVKLVRDIRFCQDTYLEPRVGTGLLEAVVEYANDGGDNKAMKGLLKKLRTALAFYVESRRTTITQTSVLPISTSSSTRSTSYQKDERLARRDSMTDAQQAMAAAEQYIEDNLEALGDAAVGSPIYTRVKAQEAQAKADAANACAARERQRKAQCQQNSRKLFTAFPSTHRTPELK